MVRQRGEFTANHGVKKALFFNINLQTVLQPSGQGTVISYLMALKRFVEKQNAVWNAQAIDNFLTIMGDLPEFYVDSK